MALLNSSRTFLQNSFTFRCHTHTYVVGLLHLRLQAQKNRGIFSVHHSRDVSSFSSVIWSCAHWCGGMPKCPSIGRYLGSNSLIGVDFLKIAYKCILLQSQWSSLWCLVNQIRKYQKKLFARLVRYINWPRLHSTTIILWAPEEGLLRY